jgi:hypothetical protein
MGRFRPSQRRWRGERQPCALYGHEAPRYVSRQEHWEDDVKAFLSAIIVALGMGILAYTVLESSQMASDQKFRSGSTRL